MNQKAIEKTDADISFSYTIFSPDSDDPNLYTNPTNAPISANIITKIIAFLNLLNEKVKPIFFNNLEILLILPPLSFGLFLFFNSV